MNDGDVDCSSKAKSGRKGQRRGPSIELQRQIDDAIAARSRDSQQFALQQNQKDDTTDINGISDENGVRPHTTIYEPGTPPPGAQYEYLDHPADIILHSWGNDLSASLSNLAVCMFGYITSINSIATNPSQCLEYGSNIVAQGHDLRSLVYSFLDEWLFNFHDTGFVAKEILVTEFNGEAWRIVSTGKGEVMDVRRHPQGTEVKAITYNAMRIEEKGEDDGRCDVYVVVDI